MSSSEYDSETQSLTKSEHQYPESKKMIPKRDYKLGPVIPEIWFYDEKVLDFHQEDLFRALSVDFTGDLNLVVD